ncbi:MAG: hypothetical protein MK052_00575 [Alphaproteobacteria bacterium]|nr:hypothetical protein [Alphaproteobacteria bacterium]
MVKLQTLKKRLVKVSIIALIIVSAMGAAGYGVYSWSNSLQEEAKSSSSKLSRARGDVTSRTKKNVEAQQYLELYAKITGNSEQEKISELDREKAEIWLKRAALQNNISNLNGSFEPIAPVDTVDFKKKTFVGITSKVTLRFGAMTDYQIIQFFDAILNDFPGYVKVNRFSLTKKEDITDQTLVEASRGKFPELVLGDIEFNWIGVREVEEETKNTNGGR